MAQHKSYEFENLIVIDKFYPCYVSILEKSFFFPGESHDFWECSYVLSGSADVGADENVYHINKGDFVCYKPMGFHTFIHNTTDTTVMTLCFSAHGRLMKHFQNRLFTLSDDQKKILELIEKRLPTEFELDFTVPKNTKYLRFINDDMQNLQLVAAYMTELLFSIYENNQTNDMIESAETIIFKKAVDYMKKNIYRSLSLPEIANHCNTSQSGLKRVFAKFTGYPVHKYFLRMKIDTASMCLKNGEGVSQIAAKLGFSSQAYFSSVFKREMGASPREFKNMPS